MTATLSRFEMVRALVRQGVFPDRAEKIVEAVSEGPTRRMLRGKAPTEHEEQVRLFEWRDENLHRWPSLRLMIAIPNGGHRLKAVAGKLKAAGVRRGVHDVLLPVPRGPYHGLWLELKTAKGSASDAQLEWRAEMRQQGYQAEIVRGWEAARDLIVSYLDA